MKYTLLFIVLLGFACGGGDDPATTAENNGTPATNFCAMTSECPTTGSLSGWPAFEQQSKLSCEADVEGNGYCSECLFDSSCEAGFGCVNRTYCAKLDPCNIGSDCTEEDSQIHLACIKSLCSPCDDEIDCDSSKGEMCYNRLCVPRINVEPTCIDGSCEGTCDILSDLDGNPKGFECVN